MKNYKFLKIPWLKTCKFPLTGCLQKICNFFAKLQFVSLCLRLSKKLNFFKIWQVEVGQNKDLVSYRKKQSFRQCAWGLRQLVLKPGFRPKGRALGMQEKSENFNSLRPILFELCKKNTRGGVKLITPSRNRVKHGFKLCSPETVQNLNNFKIAFLKSWHQH